MKNFDASNHISGLSFVAWRREFDSELWQLGLTPVSADAARDAYESDLFPSGAAQLEADYHDFKLDLEEEKAARPFPGSQQWAETYADDLGLSPDF